MATPQLLSWPACPCRPSPQLPPWPQAPTSACRLRIAPTGPIAGRPIVPLARTSHTRSTLARTPRPARTGSSSQAKFRMAELQDRRLRSASSNRRRPTRIRPVVQAWRASHIWRRPIPWAARVFRAVPAEADLVPDGSSVWRSAGHAPTWSPQGLPLKCWRTALTLRSPCRLATGCVRALCRCQPARPRVCRPRTSPVRRPAAIPASRRSGRPQ